MCKCPICGSNEYRYDRYVEWGIGTVEQHGSCEKCGYIVEQAYTPVMEAYMDIKRGFKTVNGYIKKDVRKHRRIRKKCNAPKKEINPLWVWYV